MTRWAALLIYLLWSPLASAGEVTVAVASNFLETAEALASAFEERTGHSVVLSHGSTGMLYAQISNGAPFDVFLSADAERPRRLVADGLAIETVPYALGQLALISTVPVTPETASEVFAGKTVALADPTVAPYGLAATRTMERLGLDTATFRPVLVGNVGQVASVFVTGNAELAFVSTAQLPRIEAPYVLALDGIAPEIRQVAARLRDTEPTRAFWAWLLSDDARAMIVDAGYTSP